MAQQLAAEGVSLILVARRRDKLESLAKELETQHGVSVVVLALDLIDTDAIATIMHTIADQDLSVDTLINNAGFGGLGLFQDRTLKTDLAMIDLNIKAVVSLTHQLLPMLIEYQGKILTVWSTAGFMPGPLQATYFATKAFVNSWSQALAQELEPAGVTVTVLCPWATATEFAETADATKASMFEWILETAESVASKWLVGMKKGKRVVITDWKLSFMINWILPVLPRKMMAKMVENMQKSNK